MNKEPAVNSSKKKERAPSDISKKIWKVLFGMAIAISLVIGHVDTVNAKKSCKDVKELIEQKFSENGLPQRMIDLFIRRYAQQLIKIFDCSTGSEPNIGSTGATNSESNAGSIGKPRVDATDGHDTHDGLTPQTAWQSVKKVNAMQFDKKKDKIVWGKPYANSQFKPGDKILFERGEKWRGPLHILSSGEKDNPIVFGAYGHGPKPVITGAECLSAGCGTKASWKKMGDSSVYKLKVGEDIGVITEDEKHLTFISWEPKKENATKMEPGSSLFDYNKKILYVWTKNGDNPNQHSMKGGVEEVVLKPSNSQHFVVENLEINYAASTCVVPGNVRHALFDHLEIHTCGGRWSPGGNFYDGNGMTIAYNSENVKVQNSEIHDVYDSAISPQTFWKSNLLIKDITIKNNVLYNAPHSVVEVTNWTKDSVMENIFIEGNDIYGGGKGFSAKHQWNKPQGGPGIMVTIGRKDRESKIKNIQILNNKIHDNVLAGVAVGLNSGPVTIEGNDIERNGGAGVLAFDDKTPTITKAIVERNNIFNNGAGILSGGFAKVFEKGNQFENNHNLDLGAQVKKYRK